MFTAAARSPEHFQNLCLGECQVHPWEVYSLAVYLKVRETSLKHAFFMLGARVCVDPCKKEKHTRESENAHPGEQYGCYGEAHGSTSMSTMLGVSMGSYPGWPSYMVTQAAPS